MENPFEIILQKLDEIQKSLEELKIPQFINNPNSTDLFDVVEVSEYIKLSVPTIYGLVHKNKIPYAKKGKKLYFIKSDIEKWILEGRKKAVSELDLLADEYIIKHPL